MGWPAHRRSAGLWIERLAADVKVRRVKRGVYAEYIRFLIFARVG